MDTKAGHAGSRAWAAHDGLVACMNLPDQISGGHATPTWQTPERVFVVDDEVHVWRASLDVPPSTLWMLEQTLTADERARADRFHRPRDRAHFVVGRGVLRAILGQYLHRPPSTLRFRYNRYGKPVLAQELAHESDDNTLSLTFNVSHSHGLVLCAIGQSRAIGIDLECVHTAVAYEQVAEHFFSPREIGMLHTLPAQMRRSAFFTCWTRKEAYLKARGLGLSLALSQFEVAVSPDAPAALLATAEQGQAVARWLLQDLTLDADYVAALAYEAPRVRVRYWQYRH